MSTKTILKKPTPLSGTQKAMRLWLFESLVAEFGHGNWFTVSQAAGRLREAGFCTKNESFTNFQKNIATLLRLDDTGMVEDNQGSGSRKLYRIFIWQPQ